MTRQHCSIFLEPSHIAKRLFGLIVISLLLAISGCGVASKGTAGKEFESARSLVHRGEFQAAVDALQQFLKAHPNHALSSRATFLIAKSQLGIGNLEQSQLWFERTRDQFPTSEEAHKSKFKLAMIELLRENDTKAFAQFSALEAEADGPYTPEAAALSRFLADRLEQAKAQENQPK